jgi:hypothetical protein
LDKIGLKALVGGKYDLLWLDIISGETVHQKGLTVKWGNATFNRPASFGKEIVVYVKRQK